VTKKRKEKKKKKKKIHKKNYKSKRTKTIRQRANTPKKAILWTPLLTPFAQMDMLAPKRLGFLLYGERVERNLKGHIVALVGCLVGPLLFNLNGLSRDNNVVDGA